MTDVSSEPNGSSDPIGDTAKEMVKVFLDYSNEEGSVSDVGLGKLSAVFGDAPEEFRYLVFMEFLMELDERDISYDKSQFFIERKDIVSLC